MGVSLQWFSEVPRQDLRTPPPTPERWGKSPDRAAHVGRSGPGRRWADHRGTLEAIAWKYRTNSPWRDLPEELGSFQTAHKRLIRWAVDGTWEKIFAAVPPQRMPSTTSAGP
ncbi:transposase [Streptomyces sp. NPDC058252]|uniref:transposase n=1 Tax=Streptomyces sp. NPDC058252 TaxID=3346405 RepID=UPI0036F15068